MMIRSRYLYTTQEEDRHADRQVVRENEEQPFLRFRIFVDIAGRSKSGFFPVAKAR
jgi:hypothetical protein